MKVQRPKSTRTAKIIQYGFSRTFIVFCDMTSGTCLLISSDSRRTSPKTRRKANAKQLKIGSKSSGRQSAYQIASNEIFSADDSGRLYGCGATSSRSWALSTNGWSVANGV